MSQMRAICWIVGVWAMIATFVALAIVAAILNIGEQVDWAALGAVVVLWCAGFTYLVYQSLRVQARHD